MISGYTFFKSYHDSLVELEKEDKKELLNAIDEYIFENKEPMFSGVKKAIWIVIKPNLDISKIRSKSRKSKTNQKEIKTKSKANQNENCDLLYPYPYPNNKIKYLDNVYLTNEEYKKLIDKLGEQLTNTYIEKLNNYIGSKGKKYKSHYFTILSWVNKEDKPIKKVETPEWFDKDIEVKAPNEKDKQELENILKEFK